MKNVQEVNNYKFDIASSESPVCYNAEYSLCYILLWYLNLFAC